MNVLDKLDTAKNFNLSAFETAQAAVAVRNISGVIGVTVRAASEIF